MEFEEMKRIWDSQKNQPLYAIDEAALHRRIQSKMNVMLRFTSISEWMLIIINFGTAGILLGFNRLIPKANLFLILEAFWLFGLVAYLLICRFRRVKASRQFDRTVRGDLDHAISLAGYQMTISEIVRWNFLPMGVIMILSGWESGKLFEVGAIILASCALAFYVTSRGYRMNKGRKRDLQTLKEKLESGN